MRFVTLIVVLTGLLGARFFRATAPISLADRPAVNVRVSSVRALPVCGSVELTPAKKTVVQRVIPGRERNHLAMEEIAAMREDCLARVDSRLELLRRVAELERRGNVEESGKDSANS